MSSGRHQALINLISHPVYPSAVLSPFTYGLYSPIGNVMTTFLTNLGTVGRATAG